MKTKYKNLDKPLERGSNFNDYNKHHNLRLKHNSSDLYKICGNTYEDYLNWCKLAQTPLYTALKEEDEL